MRESGRHAGPCLSLTRADSNKHHPRQQSLLKERVCWCKVKAGEKQQIVALGRLPARRLPTLPVGEQIYSTNKALLFLSKSSACGSPRFQHSQLVSGMWNCSAMGLANPCRVDLVYCEISANPSATCDSCAVLPVKRPESERESCSDPCLRCRSQISNARRLDGNQ